MNRYSCLSTLRRQSAGTSLSHLASPAMKASTSRWPRRSSTSFTQNYPACLPDATSMHIFVISTLVSLLNPSMSRAQDPKAGRGSIINQPRSFWRQAKVTRWSSHQRPMLPWPAGMTVPEAAGRYGALYGVLCVWLNLVLSESLPLSITRRWRFNLRTDVLADDVP